jgi:hypothetical protein
MAHVFIVDTKTFPVHLKYQFAATGAAESDFHIELMADINRVRPGDDVFFYLMQKAGKTEGGLYGVFEVVDSNPLVFYERRGLPPKRELGKKLIYGVNIKPKVVYAKPVSESRALDDLPVYANEVIWSLIYRKLKGNRGCTAILPQESQRLIELIRSANPSGPIPLRRRYGLSWDAGNEMICAVSGITRYTFGAVNQPCPNVIRIMQQKYSAKQVFENYLQHYLLSYSTVPNYIAGFIPNGHTIKWLGNEVACGVGMRKIDILIISEDHNSNLLHTIVELKSDSAKPEIVDQISRYVNWVEQYVQVANSSNILPIIVARKIDRKYKSSGGNTVRWQSLVDSFNRFNNIYAGRNIKYYEFYFDNNRRFYIRNFVY